jgi:hypothetical protein
MTAPEPEETKSDEQQVTVVPPASPAYATPPPQGPPDAEDP